MAHVCDKCHQAKKVFIIKFKDKEVELCDDCIDSIIKFIEIKQTKSPFETLFKK